MSTPTKEVEMTEKEKKAKDDTALQAKPRKAFMHLHKKQEPSKYQSMKVYSTSKRSSKERLQKIIMESKENQSVVIHWEELLC